jgi:pyruvate dehydrogenase E1 component beta subunit
MSTLDKTAGTNDTGAASVELTYRDAIRAAIWDEMAGDETVLLIGEDVSEAGGVFKTSEGLFEEFGSGRVINTPICENGFMGAALGMAATGLRPVVEIMFSDFLPTAGDAVVEELPKLRFMSGGQVRVPITVRSIGGAGGGFGAQHSATGESWFMGLPGLLVATAGSPAAAYSVLRAAIRNDNPVLFFEHKGLYGRKGLVTRGLNGVADFGRAEIVRSGEDVTVVATLLMADRSRLVAEELEADGISVELIDLCWLRPLDLDTIRTSVAKTGRLVVVEEQVHAAGWGATVISELAMSGPPLRTRPVAVSLPDQVLMPYSPTLERAIVPSQAEIAARVRAVSTDGQ